LRTRGNHEPSQDRASGPRRRTELRRGRALAQRGDAGAAVAALRRARSIIADGTGSRDPAWTWWVDDTEITVHEGIARSEAGDWRAAVPLLTEAAGQRLRTGRDRYRDHVHLLDALVRVGAWAEAMPVMTKVFSQSRMVSSPRTVNLLHQVIRRIRATGPPAAAELADEMASALA
jgi:hypothetical protein